MSMESVPPIGAIWHTGSLVGTSTSLRYRKFVHPKKFCTNCSPILSGTNGKTPEQSEPVRVIGEISRSETTTAAAMREAGFNVPEDQDVVVRHLVKRGNRDVTGQDFVGDMESFMSDPRYPEEILVVERLQGGDLNGYLQGFLIDGAVVAVAAEARTAL